jgi:hypothetical protein
MGLRICLLLRHISGTYVSGEKYRIVCIFCFTLKNIKKRKDRPKINTNAHYGARNERIKKRKIRMMATHH